MPHKPDNGSLSEPARKRERRKEARPGEIIDAALEVFLEHGYGAAKMDEVAMRAKISKGTIFRYFPTKQDLFRAVANRAVSVNLSHLQEALGNSDIPMRTLVPALLGQAAIIADTGVPSIARLIISEARAFPDLAHIWHEEAVSRILTLLAGVIERGQARGEIRGGNARLYAFSIIGPMMAGVLFREVFSEMPAELPDLRELAAQHAQVLFDGLLVNER